MLDRLRQLRVLTLLICVVVLAIRIGGVHAHQHVEQHDGASDHLNHGESHLHVASSIFEADDHDGEHAQAAPSSQSDAHVAVKVDGPASRLHLDFDGGDILWLLIGLGFVLLAARTPIPSPSFLAATLLLKPAHLRPLLRGPPAFSAV